MKVGRPTKYKPKFVKKADEYLKANQDTTEHVDNKTIQKVKLPTIENFAVYLLVRTSTLYEWAKKHPEFSEALEKIKVEQQTRLMNKGLSGDYNPTIAKLILSSNHGMSDKVDNTSSDGSMTPVTKIELVSGESSG